MRGYDQWLTTDPWYEQQQAEFEEVIEHGMRYYSLDQIWTRVNGKVVFSCEFCGGVPDCKTDCWTLDHDE